MWGNELVQSPDLMSAASAWATNVEWGADTIVWGFEPPTNVVWGDTCNTQDCADTLWATSNDDIIVWGNSESGIVVWGNSDNDIVVWGNSDDDIVVWGNSGEDPDSAPAIWPE